MQNINEKILEKDSVMIFIHTPFCGTCHVARNILRQIEAVHKDDLFYDMNASLYPSFMQENQIESVPCLFIKQNGRIEEKIYAFQSVPNIYSYIMKYRADLFEKKS
ncbi:Thioredoxin [Oceanobacillus limi]|uniref:Thioredoxin n=1 Tax=Oceanobacillus limi TaxID=930131 RepID=A0A1I0DQV8_9BACI|nr:thioredoxin family protein [Oceanobacillus limi]SET34949.1 Thioredoxin [Oceanobacillus limi]